MKKIILVLSIALLLVSCSSDSNNSSSSSTSGVYKWGFKLDGVVYQWEGNQPAGGGTAAGGQATYSTNSLVLNKTNSSGLLNISVGIIFPTTSTGNFVFNSSSSSQTQFNLTVINDNQESYEYYGIDDGVTMNVNISSLSNVTFLTNPTNPGKVIGTFFGTVKSADGTSIATITEGYFEAARLQ